MGSRVNFKKDLGKFWIFFVFLKMHVKIDFFPWQKFSFFLHTVYSVGSIKVTYPPQTPQLWKAKCLAFVDHFAWNFYHTFLNICLTYKKKSPAKCSTNARHLVSQSCEVCEGDVTFIEPTLYLSLDFCEFYFSQTSLKNIY